MPSQTVHRSLDLRVGIRRRPLEKALLFLTGFTGITALIGSLLLMLRPDGDLLQMSHASLLALSQHSPFSDFRIPGLTLLVLIAGSMLGSMLLLLRRHPLSLEIAAASGLLLSIFECIEALVIGPVPLQFFEAVIGVLICAGALRRRWETSEPLRQVHIH